MPLIEHHKGKTIWCPCDKANSAFVRVLERNGFKVIYTHIDTGQDFLTYLPDFEWDIILTNPPYKGKRHFIQRAYDFGKPFAMFIPVNVLNDPIINSIFKENDLQLFIPYLRSQFYAENREVNNKIPFKAAYFARNLFKRDLILSVEKEDISTKDSPIIPNLLEIDL